MEMIYQDNTLFVDLSGEIDIEKVKTKLFNVVELYNINNVVLSVSEVFNYKRRTFNELKDDYSKVYGGTITIRR